MTRLAALAIFATLLGFFALVQGVAAQVTAINYQGKLDEAGVPASGSYQMQFKLFDSLGGAGQIGSTIADVPVTATQGIFSVQLDFGSIPWNGANRWIEISVRRNAGEIYSILSPREQIAASPYSVRTLSAASADNALSLGGIAASQYLQTNGIGSGLTNLNADNIATGTINNARLGLIPTANIADTAVTAPKIASGQVVKSLNTLKDNVTLAQGTNITITPAGNTLTIASASGGVGGSGTTNSIPFWSAATTLGTSQITQSVNGVQLPNAIQLGFGAQGYQVAFGSPNGETGMSITGPVPATGRADFRFDGSTLKIVAGPRGGPPSANNGIAISTIGTVGIGNDLSTPDPETQLQVNSANVNGAGIVGTSAFVGVIGRANGGNGSIGVWGQTTIGYGVYGTSTSGYAVFAEGRLGVSVLGTAGSTPLCRNNLNEVATCSSSSLRYKTNVETFGSGLSIVNRLNPISFDWKEDGMKDIGFGAEDVARVDPLFVTYNRKGEVEGVKYDRLSVVFVNALKEQQTQIEAQQKQIKRQSDRIESLTKLFCLKSSKADICRQ